MKRFILFAAFLASIVLLGNLLSTSIIAQTSDQLDATKMKEMLVGLGYEVKALSEKVGEEKYTVTIVAGDFDVPVGVELSPSKNYIWLTANLGSDSDKTKHREILKANSQVQPSQFYITKSGLLMIGLPLENRAMTAAIMKRNIEKLGSDVSATASTWESK